MRHQRPATSTLSPVVSAAATVTPRDPVDVWGQDSFPASDPPSNW